MKHNINVTTYLIILFYLSQLIGLFVVNQSIQDVIKVDGITQVQYEEVAVERPETEGAESFNFMLGSIFVGTMLVLVLIKFRLHKVWKIWFLLAVGSTLAISLSIFLDNRIAYIIGFIFAYFKIFRPNVYVHNFTEVFMYSGIAVLLVPIFDVFWMLMLLLAISVYDAFAVWKSKHMIKMAKFQSETKLFAGLNIPYEIKGHKKGKVVSLNSPPLPDHMKKVNIKSKMNAHVKQEGSVRSAILGGGDIAFPLLFAGSVMIDLIKSDIPRNLAFLKTLPVPLFAGFALIYLFWRSEKGKFYPAMPFITVGCLLGYGIVLLI
ncbi:hypothetical protein HOD20_08425 [archaeon]|jgi:presenilin-like A22 family membrane protease|nr:hypothetical protein [archaeon]MBT4352534.1 hypothetical protein [archaeon]MBT4648514.1 hypothetical protein [archaeon]MBT6821333.1 hypothetical protein [archaeon]MBT7391984.1 hypothetical protein [archaeon]